MICNIIEECFSHLDSSQTAILLDQIKESLAETAKEDQVFSMPLRPLTSPLLQSLSVVLGGGAAPTIETTSGELISQINRQ